MEQRYVYIDRIVSVLESIKSPGEIAFGGPLLLPLPGLKIGDSLIGLPITESQVKAVIEQCSQAPFDGGEETVVDLSARKTWQLDPSKFEILNPEWKSHLVRLAAEIKTEMGCAENSVVVCQLVKLLLYEAGGFFKPHRDIEKAHGIFGTLIIQLPSNYDGGQLCVFHQEKKQVFDFGGLVGATNFHYAAFYAECWHDVSEVTRGYRVCLVYNLIHRGTALCPVPVDHHPYAQHIMVHWLREWDEDISGPLVYLLKHQYSQDSLSFALLKGADRGVGNVLAEACKKVRFDLYLTLVTIKQHWECYPDTWNNGIEGGDLVNIIKVVSVKGKTFNMVSVKGKTLVADFYLDSHVYPSDAIEDDLDLEVMVNQGVNEKISVERLYRRTAILMWPKRKRVAVLGVTAMVKKLEEKIVKLPSFSDESSHKYVKCAELAKELIAGWEDSTSTLDDATRMLSSLQKIGTLTMLQSFLPKLVLGDPYPTAYLCNVKLVTTLQATCCVFGWENVSSSIIALVQRGLHSDLDGCCQLLFHFFDECSDQSLHNLCREIASLIGKKLVKESDLIPPNYYTHDYPRNKDFVCKAFQAFSILQSDSMLDITCTTISKPRRYPVFDTLVPAVEELRWSVAPSESLPFLVLVSHCISELERVTCLIPCSCDDCSALKTFLQHSTRTEFQLKANSARRHHLHRQLDQHVSGVTYDTQRSGSPYTLIVRKTQQAVTAREQDKEKKLMLSRLYSILEQHCIKLAMYVRGQCLSQIQASTNEPSVCPRGCINRYCF